MFNVVQRKVKNLYAAQILPEQYIYRAKTDEIVVTLKPLFMPSYSNIDDLLYVWCYHVQIENIGNEPCQLMTRYWRITDANARICEVKGDGVGGEQPVLNPGTLYEYTSAVPLSTPSGFMAGYYGMESCDGKMFEVEIPPFSLDSPYANLSIH
jgi:ApaG protein